MAERARKGRRDNARGRDALRTDWSLTRKCADFYLLERLTTEQREYVQHKWDVAKGKSVPQFRRVGQDTDSRTELRAIECEVLFGELVANLAEEFVNYGRMAIGGELRHTRAMVGGNIHEHDSDCWYCHHECRIDDCYSCGHEHDSSCCDGYEYDWTLGGYSPIHPLTCTEECFHIFGGGQCLIPKVNWVCADKATHVQHDEGECNADDCEHDCAASLWGPNSTCSQDCEHSCGDGYDDCELQCGYCDCCDCNGDADYEPPAALRPYLDGTSRGNRDDSWRKWDELMLTDQEIPLLRAASEVFDEPFWGGSGYGGESWKTPTDILISYRTGELTARSFIDRYWSVQHNGGSFFNKAYGDADSLMSVLRKQYANDYAALARYASGTVRDLWRDHQRAQKRAEVQDSMVERALAYWARRDAERAALAVSA
jgi:hypothetical protein